MAYKYFFLPFLLSSPLYILGWDIGRWFTVTCINYVMVSLSPELNTVESQRRLETRIVTRILYGVLLLLAGVMLLTSFTPDWIGLGDARFDSTQMITLGSFILFAFLISLGVEKYLARNPDVERGAVWYVINVLFLLGITLSIRLPDCCQHDGWDTGCGRQAADAYCRQYEPAKGFTKSYFYTLDAEASNVDTLTIGTI